MITLSTDGMKSIYDSDMLPPKWMKFQYYSVASMASITRAEFKSESLWYACHLTARATCNH